METRELQNKLDKLEAMITQIKINQLQILQLMVQINNK